MRPIQGATVSRFLFGLLFLAIGVSIAPLSGCVTNAATGRSQFNMLSRAKEIAIGEEAMPRIIDQYGGRVADEYMQAYATDIGMSLVEHTEADYPIDMRKTLKRNAAQFRRRVLSRIEK